MFCKSNRVLTVKVFAACLILIVLSCNNNASKSQNSSNSEKSIVLKKQYLKRPGYNVEYYADWKVDSSDKDFDIDSYFVLNSPDDNSVIFFLFNQHINEKESVEEQVETHLKKTIKGGSVIHFKDWGSYKGYGASINGKLLGVFKGEIKIFCHSTDSSSFLVITQLFDEDREKEEAGLKLIETSFKTKL